MEDGKLIGRRHELEFARHALESGRGLLITGVAGVGKTHFTAELARLLADAGSPALLTSSSRAVSDLAALEARHPIVIVDDAHRLDLRLLEMLCDDAEHGAITLCLAGLPVSEVDASAAAPMMAAVHAWLSGTGAQRLRLSPLSRTETAELATAAAAPHEVSAFWGEKFWRATGGLPRLVHIYVTDAVRRNRLPQLPELLCPEARELPPAEAIKLLRPRLRRLEPHLTAALVVLGRLSGLPHARAREAVRHGDITALADTDLLAIRPEDDTLHVADAVAAVASSLLSEEAEEAAILRAATRLLRFAPDGPRSPIEAAFLADVWLRSDRSGAIETLPADQVRDAVHSAARVYTRGGHARQALDLLDSVDRASAAADAAGLATAGDPITLIERARALAALHDHDGALAALAAAEPLVRDERDARMLLNRYGCVLLWHLRTPAAYEAVVARAAGWLPESPAWQRELALPSFFQSTTAESAPGAVATFLAALPAHRGARISALAAAFLARIVAGEDADELVQMAMVEASDHAGSGPSASTSTAVFNLRACRMLAALVRQDEPVVLAGLLRDVVEAAVVIGGQSTQYLAFAKWFEALIALRAGDAAAARSAIECVDLGTVPERLQSWLEIEYAHALALTGELAEARALVRRLGPAVAASSDDRAAFALARARVSIELAAGEPARAHVLARSVALRLDQTAPSLAALVLREARAVLAARPWGAQSDGVPSEEARAGDAAAAASAHDAVVTPIGPALHSAASKLLSAREILVARLAATGRSNAQIATELFLSVRTVESHLHHARVKLGVSGREALAAFFGEPGDALAPAL